MGQRQATLPEVTANAEEARMRDLIREQLDKLGKANLDAMIKAMRGCDVP